MIYFDNAATTFPKPRRVRDAVLEAMERYAANPGRSGHTLSLETAVKVYETRELAAGFFNAQAVEDVVFTSNCTHALNFAIKGTLKHGDHVIISDLEHNSVLRPIHALASAKMITYSVAESYEGDDDKTVESFKRLIMPQTRLIACTHGSNVWGIKNPITKLGGLAREFDLLFLVDAAQTAGVVSIDMERDGIDFLCLPGHKGLYGPVGTGMLITPLGSVINCCFEGGTGSMSSDFNQPPGMPERLESGTVNTSGIIGLGAGIKYVADKGIDAIRGEETRIAREIHLGLREIPGVKLYTKDFEHKLNLPVVSFNIEGATSEEVTAMLSDMGFAARGGLHCAPLAHRKMNTVKTGAIRVSVGNFNKMAEAKRLLSAVSKLARG